MNIKSAVRYTLLAVGGLLLLLAAMVAWIVFMFDPNALKPQIEQRVTEATGRQLKLQGQIALRLWPSVGATIDKASWSEYRAPQTFAELGHIQVNLAFWPILQQRYVVEELEVDGLRGTLIRHEDGRLSIADLLQRDATEKPASGPVEFAVDRVRVRNAAFTFDDRQQKRRSSIDQLQLSADRISAHGAEAIQLAARIQNSSPALAVQLNVTAREARLPQGQPLQVSDLQLNVQGQLPEGIQLQQLKLAIARLTRAPAGDSEVSGLTLDLAGKAPQLSLEQTRLQLDRASINGKYDQAQVQGLRLQGRANSAHGQLRQLQMQLAKASWSAQGASSLDQLQLHAEGDTGQLRQIVLDLNSGAGTVQGQNSAQLQKLQLKASARLKDQHVQAAVNAPSLSYGPNGISATTLDLQGGVQGGGQQADIKAQLATLHSDLKTTASIGNLKAQGRARQGQDAVDFNLAGPVQARLQPVQVSLPALTLSGRASTPALRAGSAAFNVTGPLALDLQAEKVDTRLSGQFDASRGHVDLKVKGFAKPAVQFDVALDRVDLDRYLAPSAAGAAPGAKPAAPAAPAAPVRIDLSPLAPLQLDGQLAIASLTREKIKANALSLAVKAGGGEIAVPRLSVQAFEGSLKGSLSASTSKNPTLRLKQDLTGVNIQQVLATFADFDRLLGTGNISADLTARGGTLDELQQTVSGMLKLRLADGAWQGINIGKVLRESRAMLQGGLQTRGSVSAEKTDFSELTASVNLLNGVARNDDLSAKSPLFRLSGKGEANLPRQTLDYRVQASLVGTSQGQGGREADQLHGLTIPLRISGPFASPSYTLDFAAMLKESTKAQLEAQKQQLQQQAQQKLDATRDKAREQLQQEQKKAGEKLQNELQKGLGKLFGQPRPAPATKAASAPAAKPAGNTTPAPAPAK